MKQEKALTELLEVWDNKEKAEAIALLRKSMSEKAETPKVSTQVVKSYVADMVKEGLDSGRLLDYPTDFSSTSKSLYYREAIREVVQELKTELNVDVHSNKVLEAAWEDCEKAKTLIDLRKSFRIYMLAFKSNFYTEEDIEEYAQMIDEQDREIKRLREFERIQHELFGFMTEDDSSLHHVIQAREMKRMGLTDTEICKALGIKRDRLNYLRKTILLEEGDVV